MFRRTVLSSAVAIALGTSVVTTGVMASDENAVAKSDEKAVEKLEKVQVTGSRISRVDVEGVAPVTIITREDIDRTGATSVSDLLRSLTENGAGSYDESFTNGFAAGSSFISLRGLGSSRTLTLLNGRRVANYGFAQNVNETGVDLNSIPLGIVERVEVLKDGASAIYGSDAIAGVINIILKDNYDGATVTASTGMTGKGDSEEGKINVVAGKEFEDSNVLVAFDYFNRNNLKMSSRDRSSSADQTGNGGLNWISSYSPHPSYAILNPDGSVKDTVCNDPTGNNCQYDYVQDLDLMPATERYGLLSILNHDFSDSVSGFTELSYSRSMTDIRIGPTANPMVMEASNPNNPETEDIRVKGRYTDVGPRLNDITNDAYRGVFGLRGGFEFAERDVDWEMAAGYSRNETVSKGRNFINAEKFKAAVDDGSYNPLTPTSNSQDVINQFRVSTKRKSISDTTFVSGSFSMPLFALPAGDVYMAGGAEWREESIDDRPDPLGAQRGILGSGGTSAKGSRNSRAVYSELSVPLHETLEMQLAGRFEKYSDFGTTLDPKVAFRWQPLDNLMFRASYSTAFKAPTLPELYLGESVGYVQITDTVGCEAHPKDPAFCNPKQYEVHTTGNSELDAEEAESFNFGVVYEPIEDLQLKMDVYKIRNTNMISRLSSQQLVNDNAPGSVERNDDETIDYINNVYTNVAKQEVQGIDAEIGYDFDVYGHDIGLKYKTSYVHSFKVADASGEVEDIRSYSSLVGGSGPHLQSQYIISWNYADHGASLATSYTSAYKQFYGAAKTGGSDKINSNVTFDVQYVYTGFNNTELTFGVDNLTNKEPPFADVDYTGYDWSAYDLRGRFFYGKVSYKF